MTRFTADLMQIVVVPIALALLILTAFVFLRGINSHDALSLALAGVGAGALFGCWRLFQFLERSKQ